MDKFRPEVELVGALFRVLILKKSRFRLVFLNPYYTLV